MPRDARVCDLLGNMLPRRADYRVNPYDWGHRKYKNGFVLDSNCQMTYSL